MLRMTFVLYGALGLAAFAWAARDGVLFLGGAMLSLVVQGRISISGTAFAAA